MHACVINLCLKKSYSSMTDCFVYNLRVLGMQYILCFIRLKVAITADIVFTVIG